MGIMPVGREQKWQRIFRRFGLPGEQSADTGRLDDRPQQTRGSDDGSQEKPRDSKPAKK